MYSRAQISSFRPIAVYLEASERPVGLLVNFGNPQLEYKRLHHPDKFKLIETEEFEDEPFPCLSPDSEGAIINSPSCPS